MSFFTGDVVAKEQLPGAVGSAHVAPPAAPTQLTRVGGALARKRTTPLLLTVTMQGDLLLNIPLTVDPPKS